MSKLVKCPNCHKDKPGKCSFGEITNGDTGETHWDDCWTCEGKGEIPDTVEFKNKKNIWDHIAQFEKIYNKMKKGEWSWTRNSRCKYVDLRVDMRDGGCIIMDNKGERISPEQLAFQYSKETPNPPK